MEISSLLNSTPSDSGARTSGQFRLACTNHCSSSSFPSTQYPPASRSQRLSSLDDALPPLSRSTSGESESERSPLTPTYAPETASKLSFERHHSRQYSNARPQYLPSLFKYKRDKSRSSSGSPTRPMDNYAGLPVTAEFVEPLSYPVYAQAPFPQMMESQTSSMNQQPLPELRHNVALPNMDQQSYLDGSQPAPQKPQRKNSYPCPVSKQYSCAEHFTTSGHAARHAKKHTGKKDAICPECQKAFTRKDNMEQHRRTHNGGSKSSKSMSSEESRQRKVIKLQQKEKRTSNRVPTIPEAHEGDPEMPQQMMSASIIDSNTIIPSDPSTMAILDPQLQSSPMQTSFPDDITGMSLGMPPQMYGLQDIATAAPVPNMHGRPQILRRSSGVAHNEVRRYGSISSPSTSSNGFSDEPQSPNASLDLLASAASLYGEL